ncbi:putative outer membrane or exported [Shewanella amazonensis SB2B]|uniref:Putative outer membrane or exported n=1 Tax=Shewanella amazonensis (strain ATCC BAA-1098 / SB2B) TaxID=326297 RepID=A1SAH0_SHEAM|nr:conjugal transfer protein TraF [Shewanella amazonensis]ABM01377.1 putative outer membrane or exported [Shewanella amazonensis SB2B]
MKMKLIAASLGLILCPYSFAAQDVFEARSDALGGTGVASASLEAAPWMNPALLSLPGYTEGDFGLLIPVLGAEVSDQDNMTDKFDTLEDNYDGLDGAIDRGDVDAIDSFRQALLGDLRGLDGNTAYASAGIGFSFAMPTKGISWGIYYRSYLDGIALADISDADIQLLEALDPQAPPALDDLTSQGRVIAGASSELALSVSLPLSIVNMPVTVGLTPKLQRLDSFNYAVSANNFDAGDFDSDDYRNDDTGFNLDAGIAMMPMDGLTLGLVGRNLIERELDTVESEGVSAIYRAGPMVTFGAAFQSGNWQLSTDLDLMDNEKFVGLEGTKYWRLGAEWHALDWLSLRLGYRQDLNDMTADIYSFGTGFQIGSGFKLDLAGMWGDKDTVGAVLQSSYHF